MNDNNKNIKKGVVPFSEIGKRPVKVRHVCDVSIARCNNKNMIANLQANKIERNQSIELNDQPRFNEAKVLKRINNDGIKLK